YPLDLGLNQAFHHRRQILVEPCLEHRPQHFADQLLERGTFWRCRRLGEAVERRAHLCGRGGRSQTRIGLGRFLGWTLLGRTRLGIDASGKPCRRRTLLFIARLVRALLRYDGLRRWRTQLLEHRIDLRLRWLAQWDGRVQWHRVLWGQRSRGSRRRHRGFALPPRTRLRRRGRSVVGE